MQLEQNVPHTVTMNLSFSETENRKRGGHRISLCSFKAAYMEKNIKTSAFFLRQREQHKKNTLF